MRDVKQEYSLDIEFPASDERATAQLCFMIIRICWKIRTRMMFRDTRLIMLAVLFLVTPLAPAQQPTVEQLKDLQASLEQKAGKGEIEAAAQVGALYLSGVLGVPHYFQARRYFEQSKGASISSQLALAHLLQSGLGGERNLIQAEHEFSEAAKRGSIEGSFLGAKLTLGRSASEQEVRTAV